jgi:biopolymer transport protein ExbD
MKVRKVEKKSHPQGEANVTSLVDIALSLVIFFIVTLPALLESGIFVKAPGVTNVTGQQAGDDVKVSIYVRELADGSVQYELNKEPMEFDKLGPLVEALLDRSAEKTVVIRADGGVSHGSVVKVLDLAKRKNAAKLALLPGKPLEGGG